MNNAIDLTKNWLKQTVIGLNLCPFAKAPFDKGLIRIQSNKSTKEKEQIHFFLDELNLLQSKNKDELSTSLLIFENFKGSFLDFNDFTGVLEDLLLELKLEETFQLVGFHPNFYFGGLGESDRANYVNRSPLPLIHLLRFEEVQAVTTNESMGEQISEKNEEVLNALSKKEMAKHFSDN